MKALPQLAVLAVATVLIAGCKSDTYQKGSATGAGLQAAADRINQGSAKIDATLVTLNDLIKNPGDLVAQFKKYSSSVNDLESAAKDVQSKVAAMRSKGDDYFKAWDAQTAQIHNEDIKTRNAARKEAVLKQFTQIKMSYTEASEAFKPFMSDLNPASRIFSGEPAAR